MPSPDDQRFQIIISKELLRQVDEWRRLQADLPNKSEAIRRLLELAIASEEKSRA